MGGAGVERARIKGAGIERTRIERARIGRPRAAAGGSGLDALRRLALLDDAWFGVLPRYRFLVVLGAAGQRAVQQGAPAWTRLGAAPSCLGALHAHPPPSGCRSQGTGGGHTIPTLPCPVVSSRGTS